MFDPIGLANNLKIYRLARGLSQSELARRLSVSTQSVSKWECGISTPDIANLVQAADILGVSIDTLLDRGRERQRVMIGIDGGGSKTEFIMFSEDGTLLDRAVLGACNPNAIGVKECVALLVRGIGELCPENADLCGIYVGSAGFLLGNNAKDVRAALKKAYPHVKIKCDTDILNVIAGCTDDPRCIAVICGTGSTVCAKEGDKLTRLTGWGYLLSKAGSGFDIGRDGLYAALEHREGLGKPTAITQLIEARLGCGVIDNIREIYSLGQSYVASFAPLVLEAYGQGDEIAREILTKNADRLAYVIDHAVRNFDCGNKLILAGGLVSEGSPFLELLRPRLNGALEIILPDRPQVYGACVMCAKMCAADPTHLAARFSQQYASLTEKKRK